MIWLAWRQHRLQLLFGTALLALLLTFLLVTGVSIADTFRSTGLAGCLAAHGRDCGLARSLFGHRYTSLQFTVPLFLILPVLVGVFWGAPLVARETEQGTHRLAWTQGVSRLRWSAVKIATLAVASVAGSAILAWALSWWSRPFVANSDSRFFLGVFDLRGVVPVGYALFALAVGVAAGTFLRRTVPAMAATLGVYAAVRVGVELWLRPHFAAPKTIDTPFFGNSPRAGLGDWILSTNTVDRSGHVLSPGQSLDFNVPGPRCHGLPPPRSRLPDRSGVQACIQRLGVHLRSTYQPGNRYWLFQGIETAIFVGLAVALLALSVWWIRRKVA